MCSFLEIQVIVFSENREVKNISPKSNQPLTLKSLKYNKGIVMKVCYWVFTIKSYHPDKNENKCLLESRNKYHSKLLSPDNEKRPQTSGIFVYTVGKCVTVIGLLKSWMASSVTTNGLFRERKRSKNLGMWITPWDCKDSGHTLQSRGNLPTWQNIGYKN